MTAKLVIDPQYDTFPKLFLRNVKQWPNKVAMRKKDYGVWLEYTWKGCYEQVKLVSYGLLSLGLKRGDKVGGLGDSDRECYWIQLGAHCAGCVMTGAYPEAMPAEVKYHFDNADVKVVFVEGQEQVDKMLNLQADLPQIVKVVYWDPKGMYAYHDPWVISFDEFLELGKEYEKMHPNLFEELIAQSKVDDVCGISYTSGTTGLPKGCLMTYRNSMGSAQGLYFIDDYRKSPKDSSVVAGAFLGGFIMGLPENLLYGQVECYPEKVETVATDRREVGPVWGGFLPRLLDAIAAQIQVKMHDAGWAKRTVYRLFLPVGYRIADFRFARQKPNLFWRALHRLGYFLVFRPLKDQLGLKQIRVAITFGTIVGPDTLRLCHAIGFEARSLLGSSEAGWLCCSRWDELNLATVGTPLPDRYIRISDEGEILAKSPSMFAGYQKNPMVTKRAFEGGWYHMGDAGFIDEEGQLTILDRLKFVGRLAGGAMYSPQFIEAQIRFNPYIKDSAIIAGAEKKYLSSIINIDFDAVGKWAEDNKIPYTTSVDLSQRPEVNEIMLAAVKALNKRLPEATRIKKYVVLHKEFDPDEAEITRTEKVRRDYIEQQYEELTKAIYEDKEGVWVQAPVRYRDGRVGVVSTELKIRTID